MTDTTSREDLHPTIADLITQAESIKSEAAELLNGLSESQFTWTPDQREWSIGQCLEHLNRTGEMLLSACAGPIAQLRQDNETTEEPFTYGFIARKFLRTLEPPPKQRFRSPKTYRPAEVKSLAEESERFMALQDRYIELLREANGLDLTAVKVASPAARWLRFPAAVWLASIPPHERRHLWQARQVKNKPDFPQ